METFLCHLEMKRCSDTLQSQRLNNSRCHHSFYPDSHFGEKWNLRFWKPNILEPYFALFSTLTLLTQLNTLWARCLGFRFTDVHVQEHFDWDDDVITMLNKRRPSGCKTLSDKKHRLVCYLFESTLQMCLSPSDNLSQNPGCEAFSHVWDEGYEEINMDEYM